MAEVPNAVKYAENYNRLSRVHEHHRQITDDRPTLCYKPTHAYNIQSYTIHKWIYTQWNGPS